MIQHYFCRNGEPEFQQPGNGSVIRIVHFYFYYTINMSCGTVVVVLLYSSQIKPMGNKRQNAIGSSKLAFTTLVEFPRGWGYCVFNQSPLEDNLFLTKTKSFITEFFTHNIQVQQIPLLYGTLPNVSSEAMQCNVHL